MTNEWVFPRGSLARGPWETVVDGRIDGWAHTGLRVAELDGTLDLAADPVERVVVPLAGAFTVRAGDDLWRLGSRASVFDGPTDVLYLGTGTAATIEGSGRVAVAEAPAGEQLPSVLLAATDVPVELRGAGRATRQVHNFGIPGVLTAQRLIVCEVITPAGNWSSYPAHKHDEATGTESRLEEIYYFEATVTGGLNAPADTVPFGTFVTSSSPAGEISTHVDVRSGDVALVPHGYHGPAIAAPEHDLYYLNVMAGPDPERTWHISDDPAQAWIRDTWLEQEPDPRLPYLAKEQRA